MSDIDNFFTRANLLLDRLDPLLPNPVSASELDSVSAYRWRYRNNQACLEPLQQISTIRLDDLLCIDRQKQEIVDNTRQFLAQLPANHVLLWGPRGIGKSSLIKALLNEFSGQGLKMIEVECEHLLDLPDIIGKIASNTSQRFIIYCDDLSFDSNDSRYKSLKVILDGSLSVIPDNILVYATSNRRHLIPEYKSENMASEFMHGELHMSEAVEEKISLSERFGLWLSFHPLSQDQYLAIVAHWLTKLGYDSVDDAEVQKQALQWALQHGA